MIKKTIVMNPQGPLTSVETTSNNPDDYPWPEEDGDDTVKNMAWFISHYAIYYRYSENFY